MGQSANSRAAHRAWRSVGRIERMTDSAPISADRSAPPVRPTAAATDDGAPEPGPASRFGEAADLLDRLDTRPFDQRRPSRPWWRLW